MELLKEWLPYVVSLALSCGILEYLRRKIAETTLVKYEVVERVLDRAFLAAVAWVEKWAASQEIVSSEEKAAKAIERANESLAARGMSVEEEEAATRVEEAWARSDF